MGLLEAILNPHATMRDIGLPNERDWVWQGKGRSGQLEEVKGIPKKCFLRFNGDTWVLYVQFREPGAYVAGQVSEKISPQIATKIKQWLKNKKLLRLKDQWYPLPW